ncbi:hypothetical protein SDC9_92645 [bioreactor metagenome]|uniref:Colicin V production protein n=1 Tax=bioreactor metagenome TaxID=1076179 RepID=A0A645A148_9ZZZZ|nr:CvpA family protein [Rikenellaceae bacterium]
MGTLLNNVDILILLCFIPAVIGGIMSGLVRQLASILALVLGIWAGWHFSSLLSDGIKIWFKTENELLDIISFGIIFIAVIFAVNIIGKALSGVIKMVLLGWLDKLLGVIFAILKYSFIFSIIIYLLNSLDNLYPFLPHEMLAESTIYPIIKDLAPFLFPYLQKVNLF